MVLSQYFEGCAGKAKGRLRPAKRIIKIRRKPIAAGSHGGFPGALGVELNAPAIFQLDDAVGGDGVSSGLAAVMPDGVPHRGGADGNDIPAGRQLIANLRVQRCREAGGALSRGMAVHVNGDEAVSRRINDRAANDGVGRKFDGTSNGCGLIGDGTGVDPKRFCQGGLFNVITRQIGGNPAALPLGGRINQSNSNEAVSLQAVGRPSLSQTRTCQKTCDRELSGLPAHGTKTD